MALALTSDVFGPSFLGTIGQRASVRHDEVRAQVRDDALELVPVNRDGGRNEQDQERQSVRMTTTKN